MSNDSGPQPAVPPRMKLGLNYPWSTNRFVEIGPGRPTGTQLARNLFNLFNMGIEVVRTWLLADGFNYGLAPIKRSASISKVTVASKTAVYTAANDFASIMSSSSGLKLSINGCTTPALNGTFTVTQLSSTSFACTVDTPDLVEPESSAQARPVAVLAAPVFAWNFRPPNQTDPDFTTTFRQMLRAFKQAKMKIIPSLISFEFGGNRGEPDNRGKDGKASAAGGGRSDCFTDVNKRTTFLNFVLADLLLVSKEPEFDKDMIFAWEIMNEPQWNINPFGPHSRHNLPPPSAGGPELTKFARVPELTDVQMNAFLADGVQLIEAMGFESTVGHASFSDILDINTGKVAPLVTGSKPQFHYYSRILVDPGQIENSRLFFPFFPNGQKAFLGEFDSDLNRSGNPWQELKSKGLDTTLARLRLLQKEGCELAVLWPDMGAPVTHGGAPDSGELKHIVDDDPIKLLPTTRNAIVRFTGGQLPPASE